MSAPTLYTKGGDTGYSGLFDGSRHRKDAPVFKALGALDELNVAVGRARLQCEEHAEFFKFLREIQDNLIDVASSVSTPRLTTESRAKLRRTHFDEERIKVLETFIDEKQKSLPPLRNFILPSGGPRAIELHDARCKAREAERRVVALDPQQVEPSVLQYLNRLSDAFFVAARFMAFVDNREEYIHKKGRGNPTKRRVRGVEK